MSEAETELETVPQEPECALEPEKLQRIIEAALLVAGKPRSLEQLQSLFDETERPTRSTLREVLGQLQQGFAGRGVELVEVASGYRIQATDEVAPWLQRMSDDRPSRYSRALLETLALIAYRQPITRAEVEDIRGVSVSTSIMKTLQDREWVRIVGHRDVPGRPAMYGTTRQFLDYFGLKSLDELPTLAEIRDIDSINAELNLDDPEGMDESGLMRDENTQALLLQSADGPQTEDLEEPMTPEALPLSDDADDGQVHEI